jgi:beta-glucanase (GH16 family)
MATHRYRTLTVLLSSALLLAGSTVPARAAGTGTDATSSVSGAATRSGLIRSGVARVGTRITIASAPRVAARKKLLPAASPSPSPTATTTATVSPSPSPTATATATATANPLVNSPSGVAAPVGDLPGWRQLYVDDFATAVPTGSFPGVYKTHWDVYLDGWKDTSKNGTYMPSKVMSVHDGLMDYYVHSENGVHMVSAPWLKDTKGQTYGRYSVRFRADKLPGYKTAWLLWPDSERWPDDGEIDFPEGDLDGTSTISGFSHYATSTGGQTVFPTSATYQDWHTATIEWLPGQVTFVLDGKVIGTATKNVPSTAMHWVLQTETALSGGAPSSTVAGHVLVDWVALWTRA